MTSCGPDGQPRLWFGPLVDAGTRPVHVALQAPTREAVDAVFAAARAAGAEVLHAGVVLRPQPRLVEAVCHAGQS